ncbi:MAG: hypothetical protein NXI04_08545 [Planctomycetaceae bacterium]|nr:hypothetical protein [Planctomycetaceae bacterium]
MSEQTATRPRVNDRVNLIDIVFSLLIAASCQADETSLGEITLPPAADEPAVLQLPAEQPAPGWIVLPPVEDVEITVPADLDEPVDTSLTPAPQAGQHEQDLSVSVVETIETDDDDEEAEPLDLWILQRAPYRRYRQAESGLAWLPGNGQNFGLVEWRYAPYLERDEDEGLKMAFNMTWLSGPHSVPLPARVYEFSAGYQKQGQFSNRFSYDLSARIGVFSDFDGSAREGVRFPSHAVGMFHINECTDFVFGADYLDRDDISVLPVAGISWRPPAHPALRFDLIFPRPRIDYAFSKSQRMYITGRLGGDTWDVDDGIEHVVTYRDYRVLIGFQSADDDGDTSSVEFGYVFGREMELRGQPGHTAFDDAFVIRFVSRM